MESHWLRLKVTSGLCVLEISSYRLGRASLFTLNRLSEVHIPRLIVLYMSRSPLPNLMVISHATVMIDASCLTGGLFMDKQVLEFLLFDSMIGCDMCSLCV